MRQAIATITIIFIATACKAGEYMIENVRVTNLEIYGNCSVSNATNVLTKTNFYNMTCGANSTITLTVEKQVSGINKAEISITPKRQLPQGKPETGIRIRIDQKKPIAGIWAKLNGEAYCWTEWMYIDGLALGNTEWTPLPNCNISIFKNLLNDMTNGKRIAITVQEETEIIQLEGAKEAIREFLRRTEGLLPLI